MIETKKDLSKQISEALDVKWTLFCKKMKTKQDHFRGVLKNPFIVCDQVTSSALTKMILGNKFGEIHNGGVTDRE